MEQYVKGDLLEGANAYHCEKCNKKVRMKHPPGLQPTSDVTMRCDAGKKTGRSFLMSLQREAGFLRSWKTWKSHGILKWLFPGLQKFLKKIKSQKFWKSHEKLLYSHVHLRRV